VSAQVVGQPNLAQSLSIAFNQISKANLFA